MSGDGGGRRPRLIGCDLDGTLIARDNRMTDRVAAAIAATVESGIPVVAVTGRPWQWVLDFARAHELHPYAVVSNGAALVEVATGEVEPNGLADGSVVALMHRIREAVPGITFAIDTTADLYHEPGFHDDGYLGQHLVEDLAPYAERDVIKLIARKDGLPGTELVELLDERVLEGVALPFAGYGGWVELLASGVSKASGLAVVASRLGLGPEDVWAIGDEWNDVPMFEWAGTAVAMGNAPDHVRAAAHRVAPTTDDDGVAVVLEDLLGSAPRLVTELQTGGSEALMPVRPLTLPERIEEAAGRAGAGSLTFVTGGGEDRVAWGAFLDEAQAMGAALQARGVGPGTHVALLGPTTRPLVTAIEATWLCGATLIILPLPMRLGSIEEFAAQTRTRMAAADVELLLVDPDLAPFIEPQPGDPTTVLLTDVTPGAGRPTAAQFDRPTYDPDALAVLQYTSGSTAEPKGVMLPNRTICANLDGIGAAAEFDPDTDVLVSWLPLYHDMGLVGLFMLPACGSCDLVLGAPQDFLASPLRWMEWLSHYGGTATAGPNFSYVLAARALRNASGIDLSPLRVALNGAEPVDPDSVDKFVASAGAHGMRPGAIFPAFGMAEVMIGGSFPAPMRGLVTDCVDRRVLETERYAAPVSDDAASARRLALLGPAVPGLELRICDPETGELRSDREVGELQIKGTSVTPGYYNRPDATAELFTDGWLRTGDLAYLLDGELVVCGRIKDVIIVGGRNVFPEDVERAVSGVEGVRAGNVIAFGVDGRRGKEGLIVVAETKEPDVDATRKSVAERVREAVGIPAKEIVLVAAGTLPKTSSGKLQRSLCKQRYLDDELGGS